jgi:6-phosphogluconolactonase (cycloisomerase 2 family)
VADPTFVYVGTYTGPKSKGIYLFRLQTEDLDIPPDGFFDVAHRKRDVIQPLQIHLDKRIAAAAVSVNELNEFEGNRPGR